MNLATKSFRHAEANIIQQDDENVGRVLWQALRLRWPFHPGVLKTGCGYTFAHRRRRKRQHGTIVLLRMYPCPTEEDQNG